MTVATNDTIERYIISGAGPYAYTWRIFNDTDLQVYALSSASPPVPILLTYLTHYTVVGVNVSSGGSITLTAAAVTAYTGYTLDIRANTPQNQPTSIRNIGRFLPEIHEDAYDYLSRQIQDLDRRVDASIHPADNELLSGEVEPAAVRKGKYLFWDSLTGAISSAISLTGTVLTQAIFNTYYALTDDHKRTAAEIAAGVTPVSYQYPPGHAWRHLSAAQIADVLAGTLAQNVTAALQTWGDMCIASGIAGYLPAGSYATSAELLFTLPGNRTNQCFTIRGDGVGKCKICRIGSQTSIMRFYGGGGPSETQISLEGFAVAANQVGDSPILRDCDGITIQDCAIWTLRNVRTQYCRRNLSLDGAIIGHVIDSNLSDGRIGVYARNSNSPAPQSDNNTVTFSGTTLIKNNLEYGADIGNSSMVYFAPGVNFERNGIPAATVTITNASPAVVTYTASNLLVNMPVVFTTTGGLPTGLTVGTTYYVKTVLTANTFTVSATIGGVAINTSSAGSGTHTATPQSHGIIVRSTCDDLIGVAAVHLEGLWIESNFGGYGIFAEALGECLLTVQRCELLMVNAMKVTSGRAVAVRDMINAASSVFDITCEFGELRNFSCNSLTDGITYPNFVNFRTATTTHANGRVANYTGTLTECTTAPTATINSIQRGKTVSLSLIAVLTATSANTNLPTITGMPAAIRPGATRSGLGVTTDNSVDKMSQISVLSTGVIQLANGFSSLFTAAGSKGAQFFRVDYEVA